EESRFRRYLGGYLAVCTVPNRLQPHGRMLTYLTPGQAGRDLSGLADRARPRRVPVPPPPRVRRPPPRHRPAETAAPRRLRRPRWRGPPPARRPGPRRGLLLRLDQPDR